ncbi:hypothetical protein OK016_29105 [Vibrio chagasii]|nr:hypothetical protein [Vibrio chagasii]
MIWDQMVEFGLPRATKDRTATSKMMLTSSKAADPKEPKYQQ